MSARLQRLLRCDCRVPFTNRRQSPLHELSQVEPGDNAPKLSGMAPPGLNPLVETLFKCSSDQATPLSYPPAACCRLKGRFSERPLHFAGSASENAVLCGWLEPVLRDNQKDVIQMARSGSSEQAAASSGLNDRQAAQFHRSYMRDI